MSNFFEVVQTITQLDKAREHAIIERERAQKDVEGMFRNYLAYMFLGIVPLRDMYAEAINEHNNGVRKFLDFQVETFEKCSSLLKGLIVKKSSEEELAAGLKEVDQMLEKLESEAKVFFAKDLK